MATLVQRYFCGYMVRVVFLWILQNFIENSFILNTNGVSFKKRKPDAHYGVKIGDE